MTAKKKVNPMEVYERVKALQARKARQEAAKTGRAVRAAERTRMGKHSHFQMMNVLRFILDYSKAHAFAPCIREIGIACTISSTSVVNYYLDMLIRRGMIERIPRISRGLLITSRGYEALGVEENLLVCPHCGEHFTASEAKPIAIATKEMTPAFSLA